MTPDAATREADRREHRARILLAQAGALRKYADEYTRRKPGETTDLVTEKTERVKVGREHSRQFIRHLRAAGYMSRSLAAKLNIHPTSLSHMTTGLRPAPMDIREEVFRLTGWPVERWLDPGE
jgi:hypothetical protein